MLQALQHHSLDVPVLIMQCIVRVLEKLDTIKHVLSIISITRVKYNQHNEKLFKSNETWMIVNTNVLIATMPTFKSS